MTKLRRRVSHFHSTDPADAAWRYQQAQIDADIVGLPKDLATEHLIADVTVDGVPIERQIERIDVFYCAGKPEISVRSAILIR